MRPLNYFPFPGPEASPGRPLHNSFRLIRIVPRPVLLLLSVLLFSSHVCGTSIVFPAFDNPLLFPKHIVLHHTYGKEVIGFNREGRTVSWRAVTSSPIYESFSAGTNRFILIQKDQFSMINVDDGKVLFQGALHGYVTGFADGKLISRNGSLTTCYSVDTGKVLWEYRWPEDLSNLWPRVCDQFVFLSVTPGGYHATLANGQEHVKLKGTNAIVCLSLHDGKELWKEMLPPDKSGRFSLSLGNDAILCSSERELFILDRKSARIIQRRKTEANIQSAVLWGENRFVVLTTGGEVVVYDRKNFTKISTSPVPIQTVGTVTLLGDILLLESLYRLHAFDLRNKASLWTKGQRHITLGIGSIYYGEYEEGSRIFGRTDPATGTDEVLYSEKQQPE